MSAQKYLRLFVPCTIALCLLWGRTSVPRVEADATSEAIASSIPTSDRVQRPGWWPTRGDASREEYAGPESCTKCHAAIAASYKQMAMSRASEPVSASQPLRKHGEFTFELAPYKYSLVTSADKDLYTVSDGRQTLSQELGWAFGVGHMGQTFVYQQRGTYFESRLSYYSAIDGLDLTTGHARGTPADLQHAAGRRMYLPETKLCFGCHTTASVTGNELDTEKLYQGVTCEACHGPGANHVAAEKAGMADAPGLTFNPGKLSRVEAVDFCGACHRSTADVLDGNLMDIGVMNARFQPYRMQRSLCWEKGDARLTCTSCHDPHQPLQHEAAAYDAACLRCHVTDLSGKPTADHPGKGCKVGEKNCVGCHMPKYEAPGAHSSFTDHWIRVVRTGEVYPN